MPPTTGQTGSGQIRGLRDARADVAETLNDSSRNAGKANLKKQCEDLISPSLKGDEVRAKRPGEVIELLVQFLITWLLDP